MKQFSHGGIAAGLGILLLFATGVISRADSAPTTAPAGNEVPISAEYREYFWHNGDKPVKMLAKEEGFCFLTEVSGHFAGGGEAVRVYIGDDGYWYLDGKSGQAELSGKAMSVKFTHAMKAVVELPEDRNKASWDGLLRKFESGDNAELKKLAAAELAGVPTDPDQRIDRAIAWDEPSRNLPESDRRYVEAHIFHQFEVAINHLQVAQIDAAYAKTYATRLALVNRQLGDLNEYRHEGGNWTMDSNGVIEGSGDSTLEYWHTLPGDCRVEWQMRVRNGMRPRVLFNGTGAYIGNEGFEHTLDIHGVQNSRSISVPYNLDETIKVAVNFKGEAIEFYVNDELMGRCTRRLAPKTMGLVLRAGDDFSPGTVQFWDLKVLPTK